MVTLSTPGSGDHFVNWDNGLAHSHVYTCLGVVEHNGVKLVKVRNPWGYESYVGPYSDTSPEMTDELAQALGHSKTGSDGFFFMSVQEAYNSFSYLISNMNSSGKTISNFLVKADDADAYGHDWNLNWCQGCRRHNFWIRSAHDQTVRISGHTWPRRSYAANCPEATAVDTQGRHSIYV